MSYTNNHNRPSNNNKRLYIPEPEFDLLNEEGKNLDDLTRLSRNQSKASSTNSPMKKSNSKVQPSQNLPDPLLTVTEHPFDTIEKYEQDMFARLGEQKDLDSKFIVMKFNATNDKKLVSVKYNEIDLISNHCFPDENDKLPLHNNEVWGFPTCITILPQRHIVLGTSTGVAIVFDYELKTVQKTASKDPAKYRGIVSMDISKQDEVLVCAHESGHILLWSLEKNKRLIKIKPPDKNPILSVRFLYETKQYFLATTSKGALYQYKVQESVLSTGSDKTLLFTMEGGPSKAEKVEKMGNQVPKKHFPEGFFSVQVLKQEGNGGNIEDNPLAGFTLFALASMERVLVAVMEPELHFIYKSKRPPVVPDHVIPCVCWGKGCVPEDEENQYTLLALSWGRSIHLIQVLSATKKEQGLKSVGYFYSDANIMHMEWFSENNLLIYDDKNELRVLYSGQFRSMVSLSQGNEFEYSQAVVSRELIDPNIRRQQILNVDKLVNFYTNTISGVPGLRRVFIMGERKMFVGRHYKWREYIEELTKTADWLVAFSLCISFLSGATKKFAGLPNDPEKKKNALKSLSKKLVKSYVEVMSFTANIDWENNERESWTTIVLTTIDFLVSIENYESLFGEARSIFEKCSKKDLFYQSLEAFILRSRITHIPSELLMELLQCYLVQGKEDLVQHTLINLIVDRSNLGRVIELCIEKNLSKALFHICGAQGSSKLEETFIAIAVFQKKIDNGTINKKECELLFLRFVHKIITGRMFENNNMSPLSEELENRLMKEVVRLLFQESNLDFAMESQLEVLFEILTKFFEPRMASLIQNFKGDPIQLIGDLTKSFQSANGEAAQRKLALYNVVSKFRQCIKHQLQAQMLGLTYYCGKKSPKNENYLYYMLCDLAVSLEYDLPMEIIEECIYYILQYPRTLPPWVQYVRRLEEIDEVDELKNSNEERNVIAVTLLKKAKPYLSEEKLNKLIILAEKVNFVSVRVYLLSLTEKYVEAFELYLFQRDQTQRQGVFKWLEETIPYLKEKSPLKFEKIKEIILSNFKELVTIDSEKARKIVLNLDKTLEIKAIFNLDPCPDIQLEYLKRILAKRSSGFKVEERLLILHIKLLCTLHPEQVLPEVQQWKYPLDESLRLCRENNVYDALAFFLEKSGNTQQALEALLEDFNISLKEHLKNIQENDEFEPEILTNKFKGMQELCLKHTEMKDPGSEKLWFCFFDKLLAYYEEYFDEQVSKTIQDYSGARFERLATVYTAFLTDTFDDLTKNVWVEALIAKLKDYKDLDLKGLKASFVQMLKTYCYESHMLRDTKTLLKGDIYETKIVFYLCAGQGFRANSIISKEAARRGLYVFECGHYSRKEGEGGLLSTCAVCSEKDINKAKGILGNLKKLGDNRRSKYPPISPEKNMNDNYLMENIDGVNEEEQGKEEGVDINKLEKLKRLALLDNIKFEQTKDWEYFSSKPIQLPKKGKSKKKLET